MPVHLAPHLPYSPDLAPSDLSLFGYLKGKMQKLEFDFSEAFLAWLKVKFETIRPDILEAVFERSIFRVAKSSNVKKPIFLKTKHV
jgi:hypothetical protein